MADRDHRNPEDNGRHRGWINDDPQAGGEADSRRGPGQSAVGPGAVGQNAPSRAPCASASQAFGQGGQGGGFGRQGFGQQGGGQDFVRGQNSYAPGAEIWQEGSNYNPSGYHQTGGQGGFPSPAYGQGRPGQARGDAGRSGYDPYAAGGGQGAGPSYGQGGAHGGPRADQGGGSYGQRDFGQGAQRSHFQQDQHYGDPGAGGQSYGQQPSYAERYGQESYRAGPAGNEGGGRFGGTGALGGYQSRQNNEDHDPDYLSWRDSQLSSYDREYSDWRAEQARKHDEDYGKWRNERRESFGSQFHDWRSRQAQSSGQGAQTAGAASQPSTQEKIGASEADAAQGDGREAKDGGANG